MDILEMRHEGAEINSYIAGVLASIHSTYGPLMQEIGASKGELRFFEVWLPDGLEAQLPTLWPKRLLGYPLPPRMVVDGVHRSLAKLRRSYFRDWSGIWDFRAEHRLLYIHVAGVRTPDLETHHRLSLVLATDDSDVLGFARRLDRMALSRARRGRVIQQLGPGPNERRVRVEPESVFLPAGARDQIIGDLDAFLAGEDWYSENRVPWRRSTLLWGPPGTGKTTAIRMMASHSLDRRRPVYTLAITPKSDLGDLLRAFHEAAEHAPALFIMEDLESVQQSQIGRSAFLNSLDGTMSSARDGLYLVASTNTPEALDPALIGRVGRWDRLIHIGLPNAEIRRLYLSRLWSGRPQERLIDIAVRESEGLTLSSLNEVHYALLMRLRDGAEPTEREIREITHQMRGIERRKETGRWEGDPERRVGFGAPSGWAGPPDEDRVAPLNGHGD